jgi:hypothetical protein
MICTPRKEQRKNFVGRNAKVVINTNVKTTKQAINIATSVEIGLGI